MKGGELHKQSWEQRLREAAENLEVQPSEQVWDSIRAQLPASRKKIYFFRWAAAAVFLILAGVGIYFLRPFKNQKDQHLVTVVSKENQKVVSGHAAEEETSKAASQLIISERPKRPGTTDTKSNSYTLSGSHPPHTTEKKNHEHWTASVSNEDKRANKKKADVNLPLLSKIRWLNIDDNLIEGGAPSLKYSDEIIQLLLQSADLPKGTGSDQAVEAASNEDRRKLTVGVFFTPGMSYRTLKTPEESRPPMADVPVTGGYSLMSPMETTARRMNIEDKPMQQKQGWGWGSGLRVALHLSKGWILQTGLSLRQTNYEITAYKENPAYVNSAGNSMAVARPLANSTYALYVSRLPENNKSVNLQNKYLSTELPLLIGKNFGDPDRLSFSVLAGAGITYLLHANVVMYAPEAKRYFMDENYLSPFNSSLILETNLNVPVGQDFQFSIGPVLQYQLFSSYRDYTPVKEYPYLIGLKTAFHLK